MRLNITFMNGKPVVIDDRGEIVPGVRAVSVHYRHDAATEITFTVVVDHDRVTLGAMTLCGDDRS